MIATFFLRIEKQTPETEKEKHVTRTICGLPKAKVVTICAFTENICYPSLNHATQSVVLEPTDSGKSQAPSEQRIINKRTKPKCYLFWWCSIRNCSQYRIWRNFYETLKNTKEYSQMPIKQLANCLINSEKHQSNLHRWLYEYKNYRTIQSQSI